MTFLRAQYAFPSNRPDASDRRNRERLRAMTDLCAVCKAPISDDMSVLVDMDGILTLTCWLCDERAVEAANVGDPEDDD